MNAVIKKIICIVVVLLIGCSFSVLAEDDFLVYGKDDIDRFCEVLNMDAGAIKDYCDENNITYFAINKDNTKQIKRTELVDAFSQKAVDLSVLDDNEILKLAGDISGFPDAKGEVINHQNLKFLKLRLESKDSGGNYTLTEYITVKDAKKVMLTFYTAKNESEEYIDKVFSEQFQKETNYTPFLTVGIIIFIFIGLVATAFIIKDLRQKD